MIIAGHHLRIQPPPGCFMVQGALEPGVRGTAYYAEEFQPVG